MDSATLYRLLYHTFPPHPTAPTATSLIRLPRPSKQGREISRYLITLVHLHLDHPIGRVVLQILSLVTKHRSVGMKSSNHLTRLRNAKACGSVARFFMLALALVHLIVPICHAQVHVHGAHELDNGKGVTAAVASLSAPFEASTVYARFEENINGNMATDCDTSSAPAPSSTLSAGNTIPSVEPVSETVVSSEEPTVVTVTRTATVKPKSHSTSAFLTTNVTTTYVSVASATSTLAPYRNSTSTGPVAASSPAVVTPSAVPSFQISNSIGPVATSTPTTAFTTPVPSSSTLTESQETSTEDGLCLPPTTVTIFVTVNATSALAGISTITKSTGTTTMYETIAGYSTSEESYSTTTVTHTTVKTIVIPLASHSSAMSVPKTSGDGGMTTATSALSSSWTDMIITSTSSSCTGTVANPSPLASSSSGSSSERNTSGTAIVKQNSTNSIRATAARSSQKTGQGSTLNILGTATPGLATGPSGISMIPVQSVMNGSYTGPSAPPSWPTVVSSGGDKFEDKKGKKHIAIVAAVAMAVWF